MIYRSVTISGFGPHQKSISYDFENKMTLITGPNGAGKSSIIDAIHWALFGPRDSHRTTSDRTSVINSSVNTARVKLTVETDDDHELIIIRSLTRAGKHTVNVVIDGENIEAGVTRTQELITEYLAVTPEVFSAASMITSSPSVPMNTFLIAPTNDKKLILGRIVDPSGIWEEANKEMRKRLRAEKSHLSSLEGRLELSREMLSDLGPDIEVPDIKTLTERRATVLSLIAEAGGGQDLASHRTLAGSLERAHRRLESLDRRALALADDASEAESQMAKAAEDSAAAEDVLADSADSLSLIEAEIKASEKLVDYLSGRVSKEGLTDADLTVATKVLSHSQCECSNCGTPLTPDVFGSVVTDESDPQRIRLNSLIEYQVDVQKRADTLRLDSKAAEETVANAARVASAAKDRLADVRTQLADIAPERADLELEIEQLTRRSESSGDSSGLLDELDHVEKELAEATSAKHESEALIKRREELTDQSWEIAADVEHQRVVVNHFTGLVATTGPDGAVAAQITQLCSDVSKAASEAYKDAYGVEASITVDYGAAASVLVAGRDLTTYSHGEQSRVIPAVITGLSEAVTKHLGVKIPPMWDEPSIAVDSVDVNKMISMLTGKGQALVIVRETDIEAGIDLANDHRGVLTR